MSPKKKKRSLEKGFHFCYLKSTSAQKSWSKIILWWLWFSSHPELPKILQRKKEHWFYGILASVSQQGSVLCLIVSKSIYSSYLNAYFMTFGTLGNALWRHVPPIPIDFHAVLGLGASSRQTRKPVGSFTMQNKFGSRFAARDIHAGSVQIRCAPSCFVYFVCVCVCVFNVNKEPVQCAYSGTKKCFLVQCVLYLIGWKCSFFGINSADNC